MNKLAMQRMFSGKPPHLRGSDNMQLGTAAWADDTDAGMRRFQKGDLFLGASETDNGLRGVQDSQHVMLVGGTRGGKGASVIIPNLCMWPGSVVVIDPKGENAMVSARRRGNGSNYCRGMGQAVYILDPFDVVGTDEDSFADIKASFNPLDEVHIDNAESIDNASRIVEAMMVADNANDPFWIDSARDLGKSLILHLASSAEFKKDEKTLAKLRELILVGDSKAAAIAFMNAKNKEKAPSGHELLFAAMKRNKAFNGVVSRTGESFGHLFKTSPRTFQSIISVAKSNTDFLDSPGMQRCLASSSFDLSALKTDPKGVSLYLCLPQRFMESHYRWLRMMTTLIVSKMEQVNRPPATGHSVLMVLDEFPALRRMRVVENAAAQIAGFGVKMLFAVQTLAQLKDIYRDNWETLLANCGAKIFFCNDDQFTREYASKLVGECEVLRTLRSVSQSKGISSSMTEGRSITHSESFSSTLDKVSSTKGRSASWSRSTTHGDNESISEGASESIQRRALIAPDEVGRLFGDRQNPRLLALISGNQPVALRRVAYFGAKWMRGIFDRHLNYAKPVTLTQLIRIEEREAQAEAEANRKIKEKEESRAAARRQWLEIQEEKAREWKRAPKRARRLRRLRKKLRRRIFFRKLRAALSWVAALALGLIGGLVCGRMIALGAEHWNDIRSAFEAMISN